MERRRASKSILNLPFYCQQSYKDRLIQLNLLPLTYWHEYLDTVFFFTAVTGRVEINPTVIPQIRAPTRTTRYTINPDILFFFIRNCKTTSFQRSPFNRTCRIWNALAADLGLLFFSTLKLFFTNLLL